MTALLDVILPVFLVIGFGYAMARTRLIGADGVDGIMKFAQNFALPCLLFKSVATLDLSAAYDIGLMVSFYAGALSGFAAGFFGARLLFNRPMTDQRCTDNARETWGNCRNSLDADGSRNDRCRAMPVA